MDDRREFRLTLALDEISGSQTIFHSGSRVVGEEDVIVDVVLRDDFVDDDTASDDEIVSFRVF